MKSENIPFSEVRVSGRFWGYSQFSWFGGQDQACVYPMKTAENRVILRGNDLSTLSY